MPYAGSDESKSAPVGGLLGALFISTLNLSSYTYSFITLELRFSCLTTLYKHVLETPERAVTELAEVKSISMKLYFNLFTPPF